MEGAQGAVESANIWLGALELGVHGVHGVPT